MSEPVITITVRYDPMRLSLNLRLHPAERRHRQRWAATAARDGYRRTRSVALIVPICVDLVVRRGRKVDNDNLLASCKHFADALFKRNQNGEGLVPDDSADWVSWGTVTQETGKQWRGKEEVEFIVRPRGG